MHALGAALGWIVYAASATYRARFKANVAQAGIAWPAARPAIAAAGRMAAELPWLWVGQRGKPLGAALQWDGGERIAAALAEKRGLVMLTPHMGCFEICA
ncbi:MAG: lysophospholipid acyltransferase family protein, partial [Burkholderiales bacterium]|nr:lysophospholipid acyltransferase family protein [Burkholderiales bacterium]